MIEITTIKCGPFLWEARSECGRFFGDGTSEDQAIGDLIEQAPERYGIKIIRRSKAAADQAEAEYREQHQLKQKEATT